MLKGDTRWLSNLFLFEEKWVTAPSGWPAKHFHSLSVSSAPTEATVVPSGEREVCSILPSCPFNSATHCREGYWRRTNWFWGKPWATNTSRWPSLHNTPDTCWMGGREEVTTHQRDGGEGSVTWGTSVIFAHLWICSERLHALSRCDIPELDCLVWATSSGSQKIQLPRTPGEGLTWTKEH